jgi:carbonic anhydrase
MRTRSVSDRSSVRAMHRGALPLLFCLLAATPTVSGPASPEPVPSISSEAALARLREGNRRFRAGASEHPNIDQARLIATAGKGQEPFATILGCSDSRVPCELVFDQGIGDLFVVRVAGNVCNADETGSIEYAIAHLGTSLVVVLGHEKCGAVSAVVDNAELEGSIPQLVAGIHPAVTEAQRMHPGLNSDALVPFAVRNNVLQSISDLLGQSPTTRELVRGGRVAVVGAVYDLETGEVTWLGPHPRQSLLVKGDRKGEGVGAETRAIPGSEVSAH